MKTLILGIGNPILADDSVGVCVARYIAQCYDRPGLTVAEASLAGLDILDLLADYEKVIFVDAVKTARGKPGSVYRLRVSDLDGTRYPSSPHNIGLAAALELGRRLGMALPSDMVILAIEGKDLNTFREGCTPEVAGAIPAAAHKAIRELGLAPSSCADSAK